MYMKEVDRVLRPGGYWVLSGPPINWKVNYKAWQRPKEELQDEQDKIEEIAKRLCWVKKSEKSEIAIWQKTVDSESCRRRQEDDSQVKFCKSTDADDVWYHSFFLTVLFAEVLVHTHININNTITVRNYENK